MERIVLGSGDLYITVFSGTIPADAAIETDENMLGRISGGATLEYKSTVYKPIDDSGKVARVIITDETAVLKSGVMTWCGLTLQKLCATARVTESGGRRTVKIGGRGNQDNIRYLIRFLHRDDDGDCRLTIVGTNTAGISLAFAKDKETVINAEFEAMPCDNEGTLIIYDEEIMPEQTLTLTAVAGTNTGDTHITVSPAKGAGNTYKVRVGQYIALPSPADPLTDYTSWDGSADITAGSGCTVIVAEVNASGTCVEYGSVTAIPNT